MSLLRRSQDTIGLCGSRGSGVGSRAERRFAFALPSLLHSTHPTTLEEAANPLLTCDSTLQN